MKPIQALSNFLLTLTFPMNFECADGPIFSSWFFSRNIPSQRHHPLSILPSPLSCIPPNIFEFPTYHTIHHSQKLTHTQIFADQFVNRYHYLSRIHHSPRLSMTPTFSQMQIFKRSCLSCTRTFTSYKNFRRTYSRWGSVWGHQSKSLRPCLCTIKTNQI